MRIALAVHGRFHAFDLARALLARGHHVRVFTSYPRWAARRFDLPGRAVLSCWPQGGATRLAALARDRLGLPYPEAWLHRWFGRWARAGVARDRWDAILAWSGVAEEILAHRSGRTLGLVMRGSAHIRVQARLLAEEERRTGVGLDRPSPWIVARETREYAAADRIVVPSTFSRDSFVAEGVPPERLWLLPIGARLERFRPAPAVQEARRRRLLGGRPLRILNVGTFSMQKGMWDLAAALRRLDPRRFEARFVGPIAPEGRGLAAGLAGRATFVPRRPEADLPAEYAWGDVFVLPTIQDGYAIVLGQAAAAGLPILTTPHGAGRDLVQEDLTGWILPIRDPGALVARLEWCDGHRAEVAEMARRAAGEFAPWTWARVAEVFEGLVGGAGPAAAPAAGPAVAAGAMPGRTA